MLARELRRRVPDVTGIDLDETSIELAKAQNANDRIRYVRGDFLTYPFEPASFDVVTTVAALHHMEVTAALGRVRDLLKPGGVLSAGMGTGPEPRTRPLGSVGRHDQHRDTSRAGSIMSLPSAREVTESPTTSPGRAARMDAVTVRRQLAVPVTTASPMSTLPMLAPASPQFSSFVKCAVTL